MMLMLSSCSSDRLGKDKLLEKLNSPYVMNIDFIISSADKSTSGRAEITRNDLTTLKILQPEEYDGIRITSDETGSPDVFSFEYSGIPAAMPKSMSSELSLLFSLFSKTLPISLIRADRDAFESRENGFCSVVLKEDNINYKLEYNCDNGQPDLLEAEYDNISVSVKVLSYKELIYEK